MKLLLLLFPLVIAAEDACPNRFIAFNDTRCFYISNVLATYHEAKKICGLMDAQLYTPNLDKYELEGKWLFKYIYVPFFWVAAEKNITNLSTLEGHWVDGNDVKKNMTFMLWDYNHRYNTDHNKVIYGKTIKTAWTHIAGMKSTTSAAMITSQDESYRLNGYKSDPYIAAERWNGEPLEFGHIPNDIFAQAFSEFQKWKLTDDGKLLSMADQAYERTGRMPAGQKYLKWYIHPGPPEKDYDYYNSDGPWAFGPENEKGRFYIEHTGLGGRLGYLKPTSCFYEQPYSKLRPLHPCTVLLHTDPDSPGYKHPIMFKKENQHKGDCPSCSNGWFYLQAPHRGEPYVEEWSDDFLTLGTFGHPWDPHPAGIFVEDGTPPGKFALVMKERLGRYGSYTYGIVWDVEKMSLPHIRRKTGPHARPFGQVMYMNRGVPGNNMRAFFGGSTGLESVEFVTQIEDRVSDMQHLLPHVWGDHTYKSTFGHAYLRTHKYLFYQCAVVKETGLWPFTWIPAQCDLMRFPFVCSTEQK